jgi:hypothetical protein
MHFAADFGCGSRQRSLAHRGLSQRTDRNDRKARRYDQTIGNTPQAIDEQTHDMADPAQASATKIRLRAGACHGDCERTDRQGQSALRSSGIATFKLQRSTQGIAMSKPLDIVFLFDVDNTLIDNDRVQADTIRFSLVGVIRSASLSLRSRIMSSKCPPA